MNRPLLFFLLCLWTTTTSAQIKFAPEFGINTAFQTQQLTIRETTGTQTSRLQPGALAGLNIDIKVVKSLYLQTGAFYTFDNIKYITETPAVPEGIDLPASSAKLYLHYAKVPLYIMYKSGHEGTGRFLAGAGPYLGYALGGSQAFRTVMPVYDPAGTYSGYTVSRTSTRIQFGDGPSDRLRRWEYGINACIGYESNVGLYFRGNFNYGLNNILPEAYSDATTRNWGFGLSIGFLMGKDNW